MKDTLIPTIEELVKRRMESLHASEKAITEHPDEYREIKKLVRHVICNPVDISDYYATARKLSRLLGTLTESGNQSLFYYYHTNLDPRQNGQARYFRALCADLENQIHCIDQLRHDRRRLRIVQ